MKIKAVLFLLYLLSAITTSVQSQDRNKIDSLESLLNGSIDYKVEVGTLIQLATEFRKIDKQKSHDYSNNALQISVRNKYIAGEATAYYHLGIASSYAQDYLESIEFQKKALQKYTSINDIAKQADCSIQIGTLQIHRGEYAEAVEYLQKCIPIYKEVNDSLELANCYNNISIAYFNSNNVEKAEEYLLKAKEIYQLIDDTESAFFVNLGLGNISESKKAYKKAVDYYQECLTVANNTNIDDWKFISIASLGKVYTSLGRFEDAISATKEGIRITKNLGNTYELSICYIDLSIAYFELKKINNAIDALDSAIKYVNKDNPLEDLKNINYRYSLIYEQKGEYKKALEASKEYNIYRDSILIKENKDKINELTIQFETEQKEKNIILLEADKKTKELELIKKNEESNAIIIITLILFISLIFSYFYWKQKQITNAKTISLNNERIDSLLNENKINYANAMIEGQEAERKRLAEDLHDRVGSILSTMKLHLSSSKEGSIERAKDLLDESVDEVRKISHNLASISLVKFGLIASLQSLSESISSDDLEVSFIHHGIDERLPSNIAIALYRCVQELVNNILKHANATKVTIQLQKNDNQINLIVEDNGKGFYTKNKFTGIGLKNIQSRVNSINGKIDFDSLLQKGTTVIIDIPLTT